MKRRLLLLALASLPYLVSLFCGIFVLEEAGPTTFIIGFVCLAFGWSHLAWYANPLLFAGILAYLLKRDWVAALLAAAAFAVGLTTLGIEEMPRNEGGAKEAVVGYQIGFYLWLTSMVLFGVACLTQAVSKRGEAHLIEESAEPPPASQ